MTKRTLLFAALSILIPGIGYVLAVVLGPVPARLDEPGVLIPLLISNAVGLTLSLLSMARSNERPTNVSLTMRLALFFSTTGLLGNTITIQLLLARIVHVSVGEG